MVEHRTPEQKIGVLNIPPPGCVLEQDTLLPENTTRKQWHRPDMIEQLLNGTLSLNTNKQTNKIIIDLY